MVFLILESPISRSVAQRIAARVILTSELFNILMEIPRDLLELSVFPLGHVVHDVFRIFVWTVFLKCSVRIPCRLRL